MRFLKRLFLSRTSLYVMTFLSGLISVYDNVMNVVFFSDLPITEENPLASWIIEVGGVSTLIQIKAATTILAVICMLLLIKTKYRYVILPVFMFQLLLFYYLTFYTADGYPFTELDFFRPLEIFFEFYQGKHIP